MLRQQSNDNITAEYRVPRDDKGYNSCLSRCLFIYPESISNDRGDNLYVLPKKRKGK